MAFGIWLYCFWHWKIYCDVTELTKLEVVWGSMTGRWWQWPTNQRQSGPSPKVVPTITARGSCWTPVPCLPDRRLYFVFSLAHVSQSQRIAVGLLSVPCLLTGDCISCNNQSQHRAVGLPLVPCPEGRRLFFSTGNQSQHWLLLDCHASPLPSLTGDCFNYSSNHSLVLLDFSVPCFSLQAIVCFYLICFSTVMSVRNQYAYRNFIPISSS